MTRSGNALTTEALPIPSSQLDRYRLRLRQRDRGTIAGGHLIRQRGQSLEFREFRPYLPGDDIRHVDWRASARHHRRDEFVVRTFEHEVQTRVLISIDTRATMRLPEGVSKLQLASWFAEAMAYIAARSGDSVALHGLESGGVIEVGSSADRWRIRRALQRLHVPGTASPGVSFTALHRALPPGSVWLVLTDLYFATEAEVMALAARVRHAQHGSRWVVVVDFDSWACETHRVGLGLRRLDAPSTPLGADSAPELRVRLTPGLLDDVKSRIDARKRRFDRAAAAGGYDRMRFTWPAESHPASADIFREHFFGQEIVRRLVMPDGAR